jgi:hypothetical protein
MQTTSNTSIIGEPAQLTAPVTINEIAHTWDKVKEAQEAAVVGEIKLIQAVLDFGTTLMRAENQMGQQRLIEELEGQGIEEHTAKQAMKMAKDNPGGVAQIAGDNKRLKHYIEQLNFPSAHSGKDESMVRDVPPWQFTSNGLRLNENPENWHKYGSQYSTDMFAMKAKDTMRIMAELGYVKILKEL